MSKRRALITGISGQDGSYLAELLLEKGYEVWGVLKRNSVAENQTVRLDHIFSELKLEYGDMTDMASLIRVIQLSKPHEIYNLAAQSHVRISFDQPVYTTNSIALGTLNLLEAIKLVSRSSKLYQASSSEMFGNSVDKDGFQRETTLMMPASPYGTAKVYAYNIIRNYRKSYGIWASNGILFNHESPRRGTNFVTNKVAKEAIRIKKGLTDHISLGNLDAYRDWGHAKDFVNAMWMILQLDYPNDYVCATGITHSVRELVEYVFNRLDLGDIENYIRIDKRFYRPEDIHILKGDSRKLKTVTGWEPEITFEEMMDEMIEYWSDYYDGI